MRKLFFSVVLMSLGLAAQANYQVQIAENGAVRTLPVHSVEVSKHAWGKTVHTPMYYVSYATTNAIEVTVTPANPWQKADVRPQSRGISVQRQGNSAVFTLSEPRNAVVEFDGERFGNLALFIGAPLESTGKETYRFGPGYHKLTEPLALKSNESLWVDEGAFIEGSVNVIEATNVTVRGRGVIRSARKGLDADAAVFVKRSKNVKIEGIIGRSCPVGESRDVSFNDVKVITSTRWGDGLNVFASTNVTYKTVFVRSSDDCTTAYATRLGHKGGVQHVVMEDAILWADQAHPIMIGLHGDAVKHDTIEDLTYRDIDILDQNEAQVDYQGALAINCGDNNTVKDVLFEDIRIEKLRSGSPIHIKVVFNSKYCAAPGAGVENVTFRRIDVNDPTPGMSIVTGYAEDRAVKGLVFEDFRVNGRLMTDDMKGKPSYYHTTDFLPLYMGPHVEKPIFRAAAKK